jgi:hypothetical protein
MTYLKSRCIPSQVHITRNDTTTVPAHDLHRNTRPALQASANIPAVPRHTERNLRIYTNRSKHRTRILHARLLRRNQHRETRDGNDLESHKKNATLAHAISVPTRRDGEKTRANVWRDGHELCVVGRVAHVLDDGGEKESEGVDGAEAGQADEHKDVDLPVFDSLPYVLHVEVVGEVAAICV